MTLGDTQADDEADMQVLLDAIDDRTKVVLLNLPHNPTGKVYSKQWLEQFSEKLLAITCERGHPVYVLSDEAYSDYIFDRERYHTIADIYPYTFLAYTYNKMTLAPSQRVGYLILSPHMPGREALRRPLLSLQITMTWCFPNAMMMESIPKLEAMRDEFETDTMSRRRDLMIDSLVAIGYEILVRPKGTFYMLVKTPIKDDVKFCKALAKEKVFVLPGELILTPGCFRLCLTATDDMIKRSVEGFRKCFEEFSH